MKKALKWIAIVVVVIVVILLVIPFLVPVNKFRPTIEQKASEALGRQVQLGDMSLSILGGSLSVNNLSIGDDPKFSSAPFLTAKQLKVGVELVPLILSRKLNVTEIRVVQPQVTLLKDPSGKWNFSSIGASSESAGGKTAAQNQPAASGGEGQAFSVAKLSLENGQITVGNTNSKKRSVYTNVNLNASNVALNSSFPLNFSMGLPGGGTLKIDGNAGPEDTKDAALTPVDAKLTVNNLDLASTGFLDPNLGLAGVVDVDATLASKTGKADAKGQLKLSKAVLVAGGKPSSVPAVVNFETTYDLEKSSGVLHPSTLVIGNAKSNLSGTYKSQEDDFVVDVKVTGDAMPATDLEAFLPAVGVSVPEGSKLSAGTMSDKLDVVGPTKKLEIKGNLGLFNGKLSNFDLGQRMTKVASLAGIKTGKDLDIEKFTTDVQMAPTGLKADNIDLVVPSLGTVVGAGTVDAKNELNFNLVASVSPEVASSGGVAGKLLGGGSNCKNGAIKVPIQVHGTTAKPDIAPDVGGATASLFKSELGCAGGFGGLATGLSGGKAGNAGDVINQLGGLFGKKKKP